MKDDKVYLGDGAYVRRSPDPTSILLTTEDGLRVTNEISLSLYELDALWNYLKRIRLMPSEVKL
jgi:hypothetical protein